MKRREPGGDRWLTVRMIFVAGILGPMRRHAIELFSDQPRLEKRLARLAAIAREQGRPVAV